MTDVIDKDRIQPVGLSEALSERYLAYALSTITSRSLPDVRDGLKPVHRRLLYAMRQLKLNPGDGFKKSARVVGDVIGKYHPHGDVSIYDALVRLAQDFAARYPLVDGQGNFGNIDGDNAAAMRYTEARMTEVAMALLEGIDEDAVDFRPTYDGSEEEPVVLPARFPNLLANGASGIAVGMATSVPPHNAGELCAALIHLVDKPRATFDTLVGMVKGPDFPTGGELVDSHASIMEAYATGRGSFRVRARWVKEDLGRGLYQIVVTEMPYQVQKSRLIERIAELIDARKLPLLETVLDESAEDIRLVLQPKSRAVEANVLMESLFRATELETRIPLNMNMLDGEGVPRVMNLREALIAFIDHRQVVLLRRSRFRLEKILRRLEVLEGYLIVYLNLDEVIRIVREEDEPKPALMKRFKLNDVQAEAILNMRLRSLRKLEEMELKKERAALSAEKKELDALVKSEAQQKKFLKDEFKDIQKQFGEKTDLGRRRTLIGMPPAEIDVPIEATVEREPITVVLSAKGWIRAAKGHGEAASALRFKEGDREKFRCEAFTTDKLVMFATNGRFYTVGCDKLPGGRGYGDPVKLMIDLGNDGDIATMSVYRGGRQFLVASSEGHGFLVPEDAVLAQTRAGKQVLNVSGEVEAVVARIADGDHVAVVGENRKLLIFPIGELPEMTRGRGVILQRYKSGGLSDAKTFTLAEGLTWQSGSRTRTETDLKDWIGKRGQAGRIAPSGFASSNRFG
jgi:topoisomerase-4 subunit A